MTVEHVLRKEKLADLNRQRCMIEEKIAFWTRKRKDFIEAEEDTLDEPIWEFSSKRADNMISKLQKELRFNEKDIAALKDEIATDELEVKIKAKKAEVANAKAKAMNTLSVADTSVYEQKQRELKALQDELYKKRPEGSSLDIATIVNAAKEKMRYL